MINFKEKKLFIGVIVGFVFSFGLVAVADTASDAWNIGDGWLWFASEGDEVRGNVETPLADPNLANKEYVDASVFGQTGGSGGVSCAIGNTAYSPGYSSNASNHPIIWCCMSNSAGTDMICITGTGSTPDYKYADGVTTGI